MLVLSKYPNMIENDCSERCPYCIGKNSSNRQLEH